MRQLRPQAVDQTTRLGSSIRALSEQMDGVLHGKALEGAAADLVRQAADRTQRLAQSLEQRDPEELLNEVRRFARRRPGSSSLAPWAWGSLSDGSCGLQTLDHS